MHILVFALTVLDNVLSLFKKRGKTDGKKLSLAKAVVIII